MLKNYFKIAIAVLRRRKFFTFISLFGISFTLTILIVLTAFYEHLANPGYPDVNRSRSVYVQRFTMMNPENGAKQSGLLSVHFAKDYISKLKTPQNVSIQSMHFPTYTYSNNRKIVIDVKYVNASFWEVYGFKFLEGKPFTKKAVENGDRYAIITEDLKTKYFGNETTVLGKTLITDNESYIVSGVVKGAPITDLFSYGEMYLPYTLSKMNIHEKTLSGVFFATMLGANASDIAPMQQEYNEMMKKVSGTDKRFTQLISHADIYLANYTRAFLGNEHDSGFGILLLIISIFVLLFLLLPTLNLININISRIMERSSEIAVRKAFGASSATLAVQFIIENLILTMLGGLIGVVLSWLILALFNHAQYIPGATLVIDGKVLLVSMGICVLFGLLSGVYPAWRMSRLSVVRALKIAH